MAATGYYQTQSHAAAAATGHRIHLRTQRPTVERSKVSLPWDTDRAARIPETDSMFLAAAAALLQYMSAEHAEEHAMVVLDRLHARPHTNCSQPPSLR